MRSPRPLRTLFAATIAAVSLATGSAFAGAAGSGKIPVPQVPMRWHYDSPPAKFWEGLPIGTGRFVAMVHGSA
ncbi:MAG: glycoside hydrolase family 95 protein, partial [Puniceicoccales bacterium]|nr:glycoside hydrolase family 95 protein [Puniceicoccales bacterium]